VYCDSYHNVNPRVLYLLNTNYPIAPVFLAGKSLFSVKGQMIVSLVKTILNEQATHCKAGGKCLVLNLSYHPLKYVEVLGVETHKNTFSHIVLSSSNCRFLTSFCHLETTQRGSHCRWHKSLIILSGSGLHSLHHIQVVCSGHLFLFLSILPF
jgi:hypothetical protein